MKPGTGGRGESAPPGVAGRAVAGESSSMGKANRSRRAAKHKQRSDGQRARRHRVGYLIDAEQLVLAALGDLDCPEHEQCRRRGEQAIAGLSRGGDPACSAAVDAALFALHMDVLENKCWPEGW